MSRHILIGLLSAGTIAALSAMDAVACISISAMEQARNERMKQQKAAEAQDVSGADKALADARESTAADPDKAKELAAEQARRIEQARNEEARAACGSRQPTAAELAAQQARIEQARRKAEEEAATRRAKEVQLYLNQLERMHALEDEAL